MPNPETLLLLTDVSKMTDAVAGKFASWLGNSEKKRLKAFVRDERRRQFLAGRALLRRTLAEIFSMTPVQISLIERSGQGPALDFPTILHVNFSISHSGQWVGCAVSTVSKVGLDIERIDEEREVLPMAEHAFTPTDLEFLKDSSGYEQRLRFYRTWCTYEAHFKLGQTSSADYPLEVLGLVGVLACATPLAFEPELMLVSLDDI
ncbi:4'-phosphopantetheinyl transferase superfamily protein [Massilia aurea]|uniref:4'-phosphopantetheinyl transferase family protein n=1 Tax=Massilia aurea TaxID=373040 RepID=UPI00346290B8